jgi:hypothetical protein
MKRISIYYGENLSNEAFNAGKENASLLQRFSCPTLLGNGCRIQAKEKN